MQPVQLRLGFAAPTEPVTLALSLSGLRVLVETEDPSVGWSYLSSAGAQPALGKDQGLSFPASRLSTLAALPDQVTVLADRSLRTLVLLVLNPVAEDKPAELSCEPDRSLWLSWYDGFTERFEPVPTPAAAVLLTADLPFVATPAAFEALRSASALPVRLGTAEVNHDGFIEITTSKPQMVELAPLPGLFRLDETRFGLSLAYADNLTNADGFSWANRPPTLDQGPSVLPQLPMLLSTHASADLRRLVDALAAYRAQAVVWGSGLGRRVFSLAAVDVLDAWPVLVVCTPATLWAWQRHLELFGRSVSLTHDDADAQLITYDDLVTTRPRTNPQTIVFDDIGTPGVLTPQVLTALRRLDILTDTYRLAISSEWPRESAQVVEVMSALRPAEFHPGLPLGPRYPGQTGNRLSQHVHPYVCSRSVNTPGNDSKVFHRSSVVQVDITEKQQQQLASAYTRHQNSSPSALLVEALEITSCGPAHSLSPKIAATASRASEALSLGRRVAVVTRHVRTASLLRSMVRTDSVSVVEPATTTSGVPHVRFAIVRYDREIPDLRWFDDVFVVDLPWSWTTVEAAVGSSTDPHGPTNVTVVHLRGSVDDRLAVLAAHRHLLGPVVNHNAPPDAAETSYLLGLDGK